MQYFYFKRLYDKFYKSKSIDVSPSTLSNYKWKIENNFIPLLYKNSKVYEANTDCVLFNQDVMNDYILWARKNFPNQASLYSYLKCIKIFVNWITENQGLEKIKIQVKKDKIGTIAIDFCS